METISAVAAIVLLFVVTVAAQTAVSIQQSQRQNAIALKRYEWKSLVQILKDGEIKSEQLAIVSFDRDGNLQTNVVTKTPEPKLPEHGLRGLIAKNKKKEFMEKIDDLRQLANAYRDLRPDQMQRFHNEAKVIPEGNLIRMQNHDVLQRGDSMTMWFDPVKNRQRRVEIATLLDQKTVRIVSEFEAVSESGPTYMARSQINYAGSSLIIITQNFDYTPAKKSGKSGNEIGNSNRGRSNDLPSGQQQW